MDVLIFIWIGVYSSSDQYNNINICDYFISVILRMNWYQRDKCTICRVEDKSIATQEVVFGYER